MHTSTPNEPENLASARQGSPQAFSALVEPYRQPLLVHCYRLSGSLDDAEDLVQETMVRAWEKINSYNESCASPDGNQNSVGGIY